MRGLQTRRRSAPGAVIFRTLSKKNSAGWVSDSELSFHFHSNLDLEDTGMHFIWVWLFSLPKLTISEYEVNNSM